MNDDWDEQSGNVGNLATAIGTGMALSDPRQPKSDEGCPFITLPSDVKVESLESLLDAPTRIRASVTLRDEASLTAYVQVFKNKATRLFADLPSRTILAVLDYHDDAPSWASHRATLTLRFSDEWTTWTGASGRAMSQASFATFLEDNLPDIASPDGATVLEVARSLEAKKSVNFASSVRLDNGAHQLTYEEQIESRGKGNIEVPERFTLGLRPFERSELFQVEARLRYRIADGTLTLWFDLLRPHKVLETAFGQVLEAVETGTEIKAFLGSL